MYNVFISYLREDKRQALRLADELESNGAVVWVDLSDLMTGAPWREEIAEAIRQAEFFLACFSSTYEERPDNGMLAELNYVIRLRKAGEKCPEILPVKLNACDIPDIQIDSHRNLNELHWCLLDDNNWEASVTQLTETTLRMAKERAKIRLRAEAEEVAVKNAKLVRAREELAAHQRWAYQRYLSRENSRQSSMAWRRFEPPDVWPAQQLTKAEMEYEYALSQYMKHQVEFVERFGEEYHPLPEFSDRMKQEAEGIHKSFEDARLAEEARMDESVKAVCVLAIVIVIIMVVLNLIWNWLKSVLGF